MVLSSSTVADGPPSPLEKAKEKDKSKFETHIIKREDTKMKRIIAILLLLAMCLTFMTSCDILAGVFLIWAGTQQQTTMVAENEFFATEYLAECKL